MSSAMRQPEWQPDQDSAFDNNSASCAEDPSGPCLTFDEARALAVRHMELHHPLDHHAHYAAAAHGWQDATHWRVRVDDARYIHTGDRQYMLVGTPDVLVDRTTGDVTTLAPLSAVAPWCRLERGQENAGPPAGRPHLNREPRGGQVPRPVPVWLVPAPPRFA